MDQDKVFKHLMQYSFCKQPRELVLRESHVKHSDKNEARKEDMQ